jgi:hypothetical protein
VDRFRRRIAVLSIASAGAFGVVVAPALAGGTCYPPPPSKCNAGNGNGSDAITFVAGAHCYGGDPGNSYLAGNKGGDEIPTSGGVPNPGGNNDPG